MQIDIAEQGAHGRRLTLSFSSNEVESRRSQVLTRLAGEVRLPGFRPGKSAKAVVEKRFGKEATSKAEEELVNDGFRQALKQHRLQPVGPIDPPEFKRDAGLAITFAFEIKPKVTLPDLAGLTVSREEIAVPDSEVDEALTRLARRAGTLRDLAADDTLIEDDHVILTGTVSCGGVEARRFQDLRHLIGGYPLFGKPPAEVIELVKGRKVGDVVAFGTTLPESFTPAEHAGKAAEVSLTVQSGQRLQAKALDDAFAKELGVADLAALRTAMAGNLRQAKENALHQKQLDELQADLVSKATLELPPKLLERMIDARRNALRQQAEQEGLKDDALDKRLSESEEQARSEAERNLRRTLVLDAAADLHHVSVGNQDVEQQIVLAAQRAGRPPEEIAKRLQDSGRIHDVIGEIREAKTLETLLATVLGKPLPAGPAPAHGEPGHVHGPDCNHG